MSEFDTLLDPKQPRHARGRAPRLSQAEASAKIDLQRRIKSAMAGQGEIRASELLKPVTAALLCEVFTMDQGTVKRRLLHCPVLGEGAQGRKVYDFKTACAYLLKPKMDIATYLKTMNASDMPPIINKTLWEAERTKNKVLIETGDAWRTEDVLDVLGEVFMLIKDRVPLLVEEMRDQNLSDAQLEAFEGMVAQYQTDLHEALVELPRRRQTPSRRAGMEAMIEGMVVAPDFGEDEDEPEAIAA